jgi:hypothetical protein
LAPHAALPSPPVKVMILPTRKPGRGVGLTRKPISLLPVGFAVGWPPWVRPSVAPQWSGLCRAGTATEGGTKNRCRRWERAACRQCANASQVQAVHERGGTFRTPVTMRSRCRPCSPHYRRGVFDTSLNRAFNRNAVTFPCMPLVPDWSGS